MLTLEVVKRYEEILEHLEDLSVVPCYGGENNVIEFVPLSMITQGRCTFQVAIICIIRWHGDHVQAGFSDTGRLHAWAVADHNPLPECAVTSSQTLL